jgi:hypothetical protein
MVHAVNRAIIVSRTRGTNTADATVLHRQAMMRASVLPMR